MNSYISTCSPDSCASKPWTKPYCKRMANRHRACLHNLLQYSDFIALCLIINFWETAIHILVLWFLCGWPPTDLKFNSVSLINLGKLLLVPSNVNYSTVLKTTRSFSPTTHTQDCEGSHFSLTVWPSCCWASHQEAVPPPVWFLS